jgi:hypothetical protein
MPSTTSDSLAQIIVGWLCADTFATVVPHDPAPITATFVIELSLVDLANADVGDRPVRVSQRAAIRTFRCQRS